MSEMLRLILISVLATLVNCNSDYFQKYYANRVPQKQNGDARIVGGETAKDRVNYQISMQMRTRGGGGFFFFQQPASNWSHFCGGSVLNENYIITAAHCVDGFNTSRMSIFAGENDLRNEDKGSRHLIESCLMHPEYVQLNHSDVAVCKLQTPMKFGENIGPIKLSKEYVGGGKECRLTGWGYTSMIRGFPLPNELQSANLPTLTNEECNERGHNVGPREICTMSRFAQGACGG